MPNILMLTPKNEEIEVPEEHFDSAINVDKFEPALEYVDPKSGESMAVRKSHIPRAEKDGLVPKPIWEAKRTDVSSRGGTPGRVESVARGVANSTTLGFADEASAGVNALVSAAQKGTLSDVGTDYRANRDTYRENDDAAWKNHKGYYGTGYAAGMAGGLAGGQAKLVGTGAAELAKMGAGQVAKRAAAEGAVQGLGGGTDAEGQADLLEGEFGRAAAQAGMGAAGAALIGGAAQKVSQGLASAARTGAERSAYRATGGMKSDINKIYGNTPEQVGRALLDEGVIPAFGKRAGEEIQGNVQSRVTELSQKQNQFLGELDAAGERGVPFEAIEARLLKEIDGVRNASGAANESYASALEKELEILQRKYAPTRNVETVVGRPSESVTTTTPKREVVFTGESKAGKETVTTPDGLGGTRSVEVDVQTPRGATSRVFSGAPIEQSVQGPTSLSTVRGTQRSEPKTLSFAEALETKRDFDKGGKFQNRTEAHSVEAARTTRRAIKDAIDEAIAASKAGPEASKAYKADRNKSKLLLDALRGSTEEGKRQTARKQLFGLTDTIAGGSALSAGMAAGLSTPVTAAATLAAVGAKKGIETYGDAFAARTLDAASKLIERYGFEEGMRRVARAMGPDAAAQIGIALGEKKK